MRARLLLSVLILSLGGALLAHDFWLVPPAGRATAGAPLTVEIAVGMDFPRSESAVKPERLAPRALGPGGREAPVALERREAEERTLATFTPDAPGAWVLAVQTQPSRLELDAIKFNDYLLHDGLPQVLAARMDAGEMDQPSTEQYSRSVKTLIAVGEGVDGVSFTKPVGQTLEIVPLADPLAVRAGQALQVQVLFRGAPLPGARLGWDVPGNGEILAGETWTDAEGRCWVPIGQPGLFMLRLIHMTRPRAADFEWESFWASLTFRVVES